MNIVYVVLLKFEASVSASRGNVGTMFFHPHNCYLTPFLNTSEFILMCPQWFYHVDKSSLPFVVVGCVSLM